MEDHLRLGAVDFATATITYTLYTATKSGVAHLLAVCGRSNTCAFRFAHIVNGSIASAADKDYIYFSQVVTEGTTFVSKLGITFNTADCFSIRASSTGGNASLWGVTL